MVKIRDINLVVHPNEALSNSIVRDGDFFEADILDYLRNTHPIHSYVLDVGANIGNHSTYFANFLICKMIFAFEPVMANYKLLVKNTYCYKNVITLPIAITNTETSVKMKLNYGNMGANEVSDDGEEKVEAFSLDWLFIRFNTPVTLIKIDVEWHEPQVLAGARKLIDKWKPLILIEDTLNQYGGLLPGYEVEKAWPEHNTYLYRSINDANVPLSSL